MNIIKRVIIFVLNLAVISGAILIAGGKILFFMNAASLGFTLLIPILLLISTYSFKDLADVFTHCSLNKKELKPDLAILVFSSIQRNLYITAAVGFLTGSIVILANLGDKTAAGSGAAIALLTIYYSILINLLLIGPVIDIFKRIKISE
jgi:flagellar motor component MotA